MAAIDTNDDSNLAALDAVKDNLRHRRTIALFEDRSVDQQHVLDAVEAARWAPNHRLTEPWKFYLLGEAATAATLHWVEVIVSERANPEVGKRKAEKWAKVPGWVIVTCPRSDDALLQQEDYAACACAIQNFSLYLWNVGIGMKWSTGSITRDARYLNAVGIDTDNEFIVGLISYGYPKMIPTQKRRDVEDIVTHLP